MNQGSSLKLVTLLVATCCMFMLSSISLLGLNLNSLLNQWGNEVELTVFLKSNIAAEEKETLVQKLQASKFIASHKLIDENETIAMLQQQLPGYTAGLSEDTELLQMVPASFQISLSTELSAEEKITVTQELAKEIKTWVGVEEVVFGEEWLQKYSGLLRFFNGMIVVLFLFVGSATVLVFSNSIRASIDARKYEVEVLELIGATSEYIRRPFLKEGLVLGSLASVISLLVLATLAYFVQGAVDENSALSTMAPHMKFFSLPVVFLFLAMGTSLGGVGSYLCVKKINTGWAAAQNK